MIQSQFLNYLLSKKDSSLITVNNLTDDFFSDYIDEFNYIKNFLQQYGKIPDTETFINIFPNFDLFEVNETAKYLLDALYEDRNKRYLTKSFNKVRELIISNKTDEAMRLLQTTNEKLVQAKHLEAVDIFLDTSRYDNFIEKSTNFNKYYVTTGFKELDEVIGGWDRKEENAVIMARPGTSKTWILLKTALSAAQQGLIVGLYEGEMTNNKTGYRLDTLASHLPNNKLNHGDINLEVDYKKYLEDINKNLKGKIWLLTPKELGKPATIGDLRAFIEKYKLDMLCVDQYSLLEDEKHARSERENLVNIAIGMKNLQVLSGIPIITVSQQNRESTQEQGATTANVSGSDRIGQNATIVIAIEKKNDILTLFITKARDGGDGKHLRYIIDLNHGNFTFLPDEDDATDGKKCEELKNEFEYDSEDKPF